MPKKTKDFLKDIDEGKLTAKAKKAGATTKKGTIDKAWIEEQTKSKNPKTRAQAQLAKNMSKWGKK